MVKPDFEQFGITKEQFDIIYAEKQKIRNFTFGVSTAAGILAGCIFGIYLAEGLYEIVLFTLFFGCFLGSIFGGIFTLISGALYTLFLYIFSPAYRSCRQYLSARSKPRS
jgi:hypothetical protein